MKLTEIAIDGYRGTRDTRLQNLSEGLNLVFSSHPSTRNAIANFILDVLYGPDRQSFSSAVEWPNGYLNVQSGGTDYRLARPHSNQNGELAISDLSGNSMAHRTPDLLSQIDPQIYSAFFHVRLGEDRYRHQQWINELVKQFDLSRHQASGIKPFGNDQASYQSWKAAAIARPARLQAVRKEIDSLDQERARIIAEQDRYRHDYQQRLIVVERELSELQKRYDSLTAQFNRDRSELSELDRQIAELIHYIDREEHNVSHVPVSRPQTNFVAIYYERLDEIDNQIRRWRSVQSDIQDQRMRLRDELVAHEDLNIESNDHPYHDAREIVLALETRVDRTEEIAQSIDPTITPQENSRRIAGICTEMRDDLQALCNELSRQYKHVRHKAVVAELKQLRRCYHEMDENVKRLLLRRETVIIEIQKLDPAGGEAIIHANQAFVLLAEKEGYLAARQQYVAGKPIEYSTQSVEYRTVYPDLATERTRLAELQNRRSILAEQIQRVESDLFAIEPRRAQLIEDRNRLSDNSIHNLEIRLRDIDSNLQRLQAEATSLQRQIEADQAWLNWKPNYLLTEASCYLRQLSSNRWNDVVVDQNGNITVYSPRTSYDPSSQVVGSHFAATHRVGETHFTSFQSLPSPDKSMVRLSLTLAAVGQLALRGIRLPMQIEDEGHSLSSSFLTTLSAFCESGHQVILMTANRHLLDRSDHDRVTVFEMPDTQITPPTWYPDTSSQPRRDTPPSTNYPTAFRPEPMERREVVDYPRPRTKDSNVPWTTTNPLASLQPTYIPTPVVAAPRTLRTRQTMLQDIDLVESIYLTPMESLGIHTIGQLLDIDIDAQEADLSRRGFNIQQISRWQSQAWLLTSLSEINASDARVLVGSGVESPDLLLQLSESDLIERISRYLESSAGRRSSASLNHFNRGRIRSWTEHLRQDSAWRSLQPRRSGRKPTSRDRQPPIRSSSSRQTERDERSDRSAKSRNVRTTSRNTSIARTRPDVPNRTSSSTPATTSSSSSKKEQYRFYLNTTDDIEAAPSIGPKTAEKFYAIGVNSVEEFLGADAADMAGQIENRRMSKKVITLWQNQARLMCAIPNLRGHDAQFLVGSGFLDPSEIATADADELLSKVTSFLKTKEGTRVLRNGREPDLKEIKEWIDAANNVRSLKAA